VSGLKRTLGYEIKQVEACQEYLVECQIRLDYAIILLGDALKALPKASKWSTIVTVLRGFWCRAKSRM